jgi:hypothetical protein
MRGGRLNEANQFDVFVHNFASLRLSSIIRLLFASLFARSCLRHTRNSIDIINYSLARVSLSRLRCAPKTEKPSEKEVFFRQHGGKSTHAKSTIESLQRSLRGEPCNHLIIAAAKGNN